MDIACLVYCDSIGLTHAVWYCYAYCLVIHYEVFNLQDFVTSPSVEQINLCRKQDLLQIADHFQIVVGKQSLKKEIKRILILRLNELQVLPTSNVGGVETGGDVHVDGVALAQFSSGEKDKWSGGADAEAEAETKAGLPPFEPFSPSSVDSLEGTRLKVRLARLHYEAQERAQVRQAELNLQLEIRKLEIEAEKQVKLRQLELDASKIATGSAVQLNTAQASPPPRVGLAPDAFDVSKHIALVPQFRETEVDSSVRLNASQFLFVGLRESGLCFCKVDYLVKRKKFVLRYR